MPRGTSRRDVNIYIEAVHRLNNLGAVVTHVANGTSQQGFDAEWRIVNLVTVEGDLINRCEIFDEADLDAALARFDELRSAGASTRERRDPNLGACRRCVQPPRHGRLLLR